MDVTRKEDEFNLRELIKPYIKKWYWFFISVIITLALAILYIKYTTPIYMAQSSVLIKDAKKMSNASGDFGVLSGLGGFAGMGTNSIENELEIFKSKKIIEDVTKNLKLQVSIFSREKYHDVELYKDTNPFNVLVVNEKEDEALPTKPINIKIEGQKITLSSEELKKDIITTFDKTVSLPYANFIITKNQNYKPKKVKKLSLNDIYFTYSDFVGTVNGYQESVDVGLVDKDATVIGLSMAHANKDKSKDILNNLVDIYNEYAINDKNTESKKTKDFIDERIVLISKELGDVESDKERFKLDNDIIDIPSEAKLNMGIYNETRRRGIELETQIEVSRMLLSYIDNQTSTFQILPTNVGLDNPSATSNITAYNKLVMDRNRLLENATPENPLVKEVSKDLIGLRVAMRESLQQFITNLISTKNLNERENYRSDNEVKKVPGQEKLFRNIERQQQIKENLYLLLLQKREEAAISMAMSDNKARVVDHAYIMKNQVAPKKMISLLAALVIGSLIPFLFIYIKELLNNKLISKHDLEKLTTTPILSEIPRLYKRDGEIIKNNDVSPLAESFRILVTNLNFMLPKDRSAKTVFVTSTIKGEGKTFVSVNLALALASATKKVLVIGSDIRNPQLQRYNPAMKNVKGLSEYLYEEIENAKEIIHPSGYHPNCDFIYSGVIPPNPTDLLQNGRYSQLIDSVKDDYHFIILDTAPLMLVTDSFLISDTADATVYVTRSEVTQKDFINFANNNIDAAKIKNVGFVLNDVHKNNFGYGNKYGYGYQAEEKKWWQKIL
ncbi:GumC family protein [Epilithonimonas lactis]|uniref:non-specific protein-tyrosine kinase n=1 Tax=Epilithonimonas lactis TaxID=421072 RepID=A0A085BFJ8_9FLAO|nr:tyrosine-protein kinase [Epilithonimonas lactis]KFC21243.1 capsular biosynthesis protein [Epilithonimonas lactis]SEP78345.1 capsular exopolysaccharide family [Epilithonimonas lactis]